MAYIEADCDEFEGVGEDCQVKMEYCRDERYPHFECYRWGTDVEGN
jgi:hypothetical protein